MKYYFPKRQDTFLKKLSRIICQSLKVVVIALGMITAFTIIAYILKIVVFFIGMALQALGA